MIFFTPLDLVTLLILLYHFSCVIHETLEWEKRRFFAYMAASRYIKEGRKSDP